MLWPDDRKRLAEPMATARSFVADGLLSPVLRNGELESCPFLVVRGLNWTQRRLAENRPIGTERLVGPPRHNSRCCRVEYRLPFV